MQRFCQTLELINDPFLIKEFEHQRIWPEVESGMKEIGILDLQIFRYENILFMIIDTEDYFDWEKDMPRLAKFPRLAEWEEYMLRYQKINPWATSEERWKRMKKVFQLDTEHPQNA